MKLVVGIADMKITSNPTAEEVGGNVNRILTIKLFSGSVEIKSLRDGSMEGEKFYSKGFPISYPTSLAHGFLTRPEVSGYSRFTHGSLGSEQASLNQWDDSR